MIFTEYYSRYLYDLSTKIHAEKDDDEDDDDDDDDDDEDPENDELLLIRWKHEKIENMRK
jgi:hypothetical protein